MDAESIELDTTLYSEQAIFRTSYKFTGKAYLFLTRKGINTIVVEFRPKDDSHSLSEVTGAFLNELIDQQMRFALAKETAVVREWIVAQAFVESDLPYSGLLPEENAPNPLV